MGRKLKDYELIIIRGYETRASERRAVTLAKIRPIHRSAKRRHVVNKVMDTLRDWRSSRFEYEGPVIHGLRASLCEKGYGWPRSDAEARSIVAEAISLLGYQRPSWSEGQPSYTDTRENCAWCARPIESDRLFGSQRHCSTECAKAAALHYRGEDKSPAAYRAATRLINAAKAPPKPCEYCGTAFQSDREDARFCSPGCVSRWQKGEGLRLDITCEVCGTVTKPRKAHSTACSHACAAVIRRRRELLELENQRRVCRHCGDEFTPNSRKQLICMSDACARAARRSSYHHRKTETFHHLRCTCCGVAFASKMPWARFCSPACRDTPPRVIAGKIRRLTPPVFDYVMRMAA